MDVAFVAVRAVHYAACMLLAGEFLFALVVPGRTATTHASLSRHVRIVTPWAWWVAVASGVLWFVIVSASMAGVRWTEAFRRDTLRVVLRETTFGHVSLLRGGAFAVLGAVLVFNGRCERMHRSLGHFALVVAALALLTLALVGHAAAAGPGIAHTVHVGADMVHLAVAGAWLGALPALVHYLTTGAARTDVASATTRFSVLGVTCVALLIATGIVNTLFLVGSPSALIGTPYGRWLIAKLAVFVVLLGLAAVNRMLLTPRIVHHDGAAVVALRRNAIVEIAGGAVIIAIVGVLGVTVPAAHSMQLGHMPPHHGHATSPE